MKKWVVGILSIAYVLASSIGLTACKEDETENSVQQSSTHEHSYIAEVVNPTCEEAGYTSYICHCGKSYRDNFMPMLKHIEVIGIAVEATCTENGLTAGSHCSKCGEFFAVQEEIPALGHTEETIAGSMPTCTEAGFGEGKRCSVCKEMLTTQEMIPPLGHFYNSILIPPTSTESGYTLYICTICGAQYIDNYTEPTD